MIYVSLFVYCLCIFVCGLMNIICTKYNTVGKGSLGFNGVSIMPMNSCCAIVNVSAKSQKCGTKEVRRKGTEPDEPSVQLPANVLEASGTAKNLPQSARAGTAAGHSRNDARKKDEGHVKYVTKTTGTGQLCICSHSICT